MSMQFLCNMTFTAIAAGAVPMVAAPDPQGHETATQRRRRQREASVQRRFRAYQDRLDNDRNGRNNRPYYDDRRNERPYYNDRRNADYSFSGRGGRGGGRQGGSRARSLSRHNDRGRRPHSPAYQQDRGRAQPQNAGWGPPPPPNSSGIRNGGWDMPIVVVDAPPAASREAIAVPATPAASPEAIALPEPVEVAEVAAVSAPVEVADAAAVPASVEVADAAAVPAPEAFAEAAAVPAPDEVADAAAGSPPDEVAEVVDLAGDDELVDVPLEGEN